MNPESKNYYEILIKPTRNWFDIDWQGLVRYRDLLYILVRRDFLAKYRQTILGPTWFLIQPLLTTLVFTIIFGNFSKISTNGTPHILFYLIGLLLWGNFAQCLTSISSSLQSNSHLFSKVYFPRLIIPLSIIISNLFTFVIQFTLFIGFYIYYKFFSIHGNTIHTNVLVIVLPLILLQISALSLGAGLWVATLSIKYRDVQHLIGFLTQLWMYATPIIYPVSVVPDKWRICIAFNPMAWIVEFYRYSFLGGVSISPYYMWSSILITVFIFLSGVLVFNRAERTFVDWI